VSKLALGSRASAVRETIAALCEQPLLDPADLVHEVAERVRRVVPYDMGAWMRTDPETLLPTDLLMVGSPPAEGGQASKARNEFVEQDFNHFVDLDRTGRSVATLAAATGGELSLSGRYRFVYAPNGLNDELRLLARSGSSTWALGCLIRATDQPAFSIEESRYVASVARHLGHGLRANLARPQPAAPLSGAPGMLVLDKAGRIEAATPEARRWSADMPRWSPGETPLPIAMVALQAQANVDGDTRAARVRMRIPTGGWLLVHADVLVDGDHVDGDHVDGDHVDGDHGDSSGSERVAVMLEPAGPAEMLPLLLALHGLTDRERQVTELLIGGHGTDDIAERLSISRHTLRDHLKSIFSKVGVSSRAELTASLR
jgi:DNA-binding CsgD family transcriptional regulator